MSGYQLLPELAADDYARLKADIAERGVLVPVEVDEHGVVLDGHHRQRIAAELGVECPTVTRIGLAEHEKRLHAVSLNLARRHLTDAQKVLLGRTIEPDVAEAARRRQGARTDLSPTGDTSTEVDTTSATTDAEVERTVNEVAEKVGIGSGRTYERHRNTLAEAERVAPDVAAKAEAGEATMRDVAKAVRQAKKAERVADLTANNPTVAIGIYTTIAIDPPWQYDNTATRAAAADHYPTMSLDELADLYVPAADDAHLYLWVTNPFLPDAFRLLAAWDFTYKTTITWTKPQMGLGNYFRSATEHVLFAVRGNLPTLTDNTPTWFTADRRQHSEKPDEFYDLAEANSPGPRLEMFARRPRPGWDAWGNEAAA